MLKFVLMVVYVYLMEMILQHVNVLNTGVDLVVKI